MAADNLAAILPALSQTFSKRLVKVWNRQALTAGILTVEDEQGQGDAKQVAWDVAFSGATAASFAEGSDVAPSEFNQDPLVPAVLPFGQYRGAFKLSNLEINAASRSIANAAALGNLLGTRLEGTLTKIVSVINADILSGTGADGSGNPTIVGMIPAMSASGLYASISKTTYPEWAGNVLANGGVARPLTFDLMANAEANIFQASGLEPDAILTTAGIARKYEGMFETGKRTVNDGGSPVNAYQGSTSVGVTGVKTNLYWRGKPIVRDRNMPPGTLIMVNFGEMFLKPLPFNPLSPDGVQVQQTALPSSNGAMSAPTGLACVVYPLARTGSAIPFVAEVYIQLKVARVNAHALVQDISEV
jgi:hypothetical protein